MGRAVCHGERQARAGPVDDPIYVLFDFSRGSPLETPALLAVASFHGHGPIGTYSVCFSSVLIVRTTTSPLFTPTRT